VKRDVGSGWWSRLKLSGLRKSRKVSERKEVSVGLEPWGDCCPREGEKGATGAEVGGRCGWNSSGRVGGEMVHSEEKGGERRVSHSWSTKRTSAGGGEKSY